MASPTHVTQQYATTGGAATTSLTFNIPSTGEDGDIFVLLVSSDDSTSTTQFSINTGTYPGWEKQGEWGDANVDAHIAIFTKSYTGTEGSTVRVDAASADEMCGVNLLVRGGLYSGIVVGGTTDTGSPWVVSPSGLTSNDWLCFAGLSVDGADVGTVAVSGTGWTKIGQRDSGTSGNDAINVSAKNSFTGSTVASCTYTTGDKTDGAALCWIAVPEDPSLTVACSTEELEISVKRAVFPARMRITVGNTASITQVSAYLDASVSGPVDINSRWSNDANAFDGSTSTFATYNATGVGTLDSNGVDLDLTSYEDSIVGFRTRIYGYVSGAQTVSFTADGFSGSAGTDSTTAGWGEWSEQEAYALVADNASSLQVLRGDWGFNNANYSITTANTLQNAYAYRCEIEFDIGQRDTYYFNGTVSDPDEAWTGDSNITDNNTSTAATCSTYGTSVSNYLQVDGTSSPSSRSNIIKAVYVRPNVLDGDTSYRLALYVFPGAGGSALLSTTIVNFNVVDGPTHTYVLNPPPGGWTWEEIANLELKVACQTTSGTTATSVTRVDVIVNSYETGPNAAITFTGNINFNTEELEISASQATIDAGTSRNVICLTEELDIAKNDATISTNVPLTVACSTEQLKIFAGMPQYPVETTTTTTYIDATTHFAAGAWTNGSNAYDGSDTTYASFVAEDPIQSQTQREIHLEGTALGSFKKHEEGKIISVRLRTKVTTDSADTVKIFTSWDDAHPIGWDQRLSTDGDWTDWRTLFYVDHDTWMHDLSHGHHDMSDELYVYVEPSETASMSLGEEVRLYKIEVEYKQFVDHRILLEYDGTSTPAPDFPAIFADFDSGNNVSDPDSKWDANYKPSEANIAGSVDSNYLQITGTDIFDSGPVNTGDYAGLIAPIREIWVQNIAEMREIAHSYVLKTAIFTKNRETLLATITSEQNPALTASLYSTGSEWIRVDTPPGGWTKQKIADLEVVHYLEGTGPASAIQIENTVFRIIIDNVTGKRQITAPPGQIKKGRGVNGDTQDLYITANNATVSIGLNVTAATQSLQVTDNDATVTTALNLNVTCTTEELDFANTNANVNKCLCFTTGTKTLQFTDTDATVVTNVPLVVTAVTYELQLSNNNATVNLARGAIGDTEELQLTEQNANVNAEFSVDALTEPIEIANTNASVNRSNLSIAQTEALDLTNTNALVNRTNSFTTATQQLQVADNDATISLNVPLVVTCLTEELDITDNDATVTLNVPLVVTCLTEALDITDSDATVTTNVPLAVAAVTEELQITDTDATIGANIPRNVDCTTETLDIAVTPAGINAKRIVASTSQTTLLTDADATVNAERVVSGSVEQLTLDPALSVVQLNKSLSCSTEPLDITNSGSTVNLERNVTSNISELDIATIVAQVFRGQNLDVTCSTETLSISDTDATISTSVPLVVTGVTEQLQYIDSDAQVTLNYIYTCLTEALELANTNATISTSDHRDVICSTESLDITATPAGINGTRIVTTPVELTVLSDADAIVNTARGVSGLTESLQLADSDSIVNAALGVISPTEGLDISASRASITGTIACNTEELDITVTTATVTTNAPLIVSATTEQLQITDNDSSVTRGVIVLGTTEALDITVTAAGVNSARGVPSTTELLEISDSDATVFLGENLDVIASTEQIALTEQNASVTKGFLVTGFVEVLTLANTDATLSASRGVLASTELLEFIETTAGISKLPANVGPGSMIWVVPPAEEYVLVDNKFIQL